MAAADGQDAASGALGAVVGEVTAEQFVKRFINDQLEDPAKLKNLTPKEQEQYCKDVDQLKQRGVDLSKLSAGLAAALVGGDVNIAAQTGGNAAQNNAVVVVPIMLELVDKGLQAYDALRLAKAIDAGNHDEALDIAQEISIGLATDAIPGNVILAKIGITLNKFGLVGLGGTLLRKLGGDAVEAGAKFANNKRLVEHFKKHGADFGAKSPAEYEKLASEFLENVKPQGVLEKVRPSDGAIVRYNPKTEEFGILDKSGTVKTYYKPQPGQHPYKTNKEYFDAQR